MIWKRNEGILVKLLTITAEMNMTVWVRVGLRVCVGVQMLVFIMIMSSVRL